MPRSIISLRIDDGLLEDIYRLARLENRTRSNMIRILLDEGIQTAKECGDFKKKPRKAKARSKRALATEVTDLAKGPLDQV